MSDIEFLRLGLGKEILGDNHIEIKTKLNRIISQSRRRSKRDKCFYCNEEKTSFCNSHSVPAFCLKNIADNGSLYYSNTLIDVAILDYEKGVKNAGTFQLICRECDSKIFQQYEDPNNYECVPTPRMLAQIAIKNYLRHIGKRLNEHAIYDIMHEINPIMKQFTDDMHNIQELDLLEYKDGLKKAKRISEKNWNGEYYLFCYEKLNYVVPVAFQGSITLIVDLDGNIINNIYNKDDKYRTQDVHICIFPLKEKSVVMMFIDSNSKRYRNFYKKFNKLSHNDKLSLINYIIFLYSEDVFLSKKIPKEILEHDRLIEVCQQSSVAILDNPLVDVTEALKEEYDLSRMNEIPNLLSEQYKLR